ncbi:MAG: AI-2E family transporter, partial [Clostridiales bacterium]
GGQTGMGVGLLITYGVTTTCRYVLEPKLVGDRVGLHPLAALAAIFIGLEIFGVVGLIIGPILLAVLVAFFTERQIKKAADRVAADQEWQNDDAEKPVDPLGE